MRYQPKGTGSESSLLQANPTIAIATRLQSTRALPKTNGQRAIAAKNLALRHLLANVGDLLNCVAKVHGSWRKRSLQYFTLQCKVQPASGSGQGDSSQCVSKRRAEIAGCEPDGHIIS